jgi:serine/threonine protein phosphatase PrpC
MVSDEDILEIIQQAAGDSTRVVEDLVAAANEAGGKDNISIVVVNAVEA